MNQGKALYELQEIDLALLRNHKRLQAIADQLADNAAVQSAQAQVAATESHLHPLRTKMRDLDLQIQSARAKREATDKRLYSGTVSNPKELQDMQHEIEALKKWDSELEERLLEAMVEVEDGEAALLTAHTALETVLQEAAAENTELLEEKQALESEIPVLQVRREQAVRLITAANLQLYEDMRPQKANQPIARLSKDDTCSICGIGQLGTVAKDIRRGEELIKCKNCKRILVAI